MENILHGYPPDDHLTDDQLIRLVAKQPAAFTEIYRRYGQRVYRYILLRTHHVQDAEDITTLTFIAALKSIQRYRGDGSIISWLIGIARNQVATFYRNQHPGQPLESTIISIDPHLELKTDQQLQLERVFQALNDLPPDRAEAVILRLYMGFSVKEASTIMKRSQAAVKMLVYRGVRDLRYKLNAPKETSND